MHQRPHFTKFIILSIALHATIIAAALFLIEPAPEIPSITPVRIVNLPPQASRQLPPVQQRPAPPRPTPPPPAQPAPREIPQERRLRPEEVPLPKKFGTGDEIKLPKTLPRTGIPGGGEQGSETGKPGMGLGPGIEPHRGKGPLPFLSQNDIDELARKGMPEQKAGDDSVTLDTDEFKFISYNRWLKIKVESVLKYPELAAQSGYQGTLYIRFDILKDGTLGDVEVLKSSGYKILDDEAVRSIRSAAPFQPLPDDWGMKQYSIRAAVIFYLGVGYIR